MRSASGHAVLAWLAPEGGLSCALRPLMAWRTGIVQVLTTRTAIVDLLDLDDVTVPYADRSEPLGLGAFPLALDGAAHEAARDLVKGALEDSEAMHQAGVDEAERVVRAAVARRGPGHRLGRTRTVDAVGGVIDPALKAWVERWFGLRGLGDELLLSGRFVVHATFLNPALPTMALDLRGLRRAVDHLDAQRAALVDPIKAAPAGTVSHALLERTGDVDLVARHLQGLTVGPLALGSKVLAEGLHDLLGRPPALGDVRSSLDGEHAFRTGLRRCPPLPGVLRENPVPRRVQGGRRRVTVPKGLVLAATACPAHLGDTGQPDLAFGHGGHLCLGPTQITEVAGRMLWALAEGRPRRRAGLRGRLVEAPAPPGVRRWPFPGHLEVLIEA